MVDALLIIVVVVVILLPPKWDPAIWLAEWLHGWPENKGSRPWRKKR